MMRREISSSATVFYKIGALVIFGIGMPLFFLSGLNVSSLESFIFAGIYVLIGFIMIQKALKLKKVEMTDTGLFISEINFGRSNEVFIPFEEIKNVRRSLWTRNNAENIIIEFTDPTRFGGKITFAAKFRFFGFFEHPIVKELNNKAENARLQTQIKMPNY